MSAWDKYHWFCMGFVAALLLCRLTPEPKHRASKRGE